MEIKVKSTIRNVIDIGENTLQEFIAEKAMDWEANTKMIISNNAVDTGDLLNSIYTEIKKDSFIGISSAEHAKYWEFGTHPHFVPFYSKSGEPILADWGRRVLKLKPEEMKKMGGIVVSNEEIAMMRRSLAKL